MGEKEPGLMKSLLIVGLTAIFIFVGFLFFPREKVNDVEQKSTEEEVVNENISDLIQEKTFTVSRECPAFYFNQWKDNVDGLVMYENKEFGFVLYHFPDDTIEKWDDNLFFASNELRERNVPFLEVTENKEGKTAAEVMVDEVNSNHYSYPPCVGEINGYPFFVHETREMGYWRMIITSEKYIFKHQLRGLGLRFDESITGIIARDVDWPEEVTTKTAP